MFELSRRNLLGTIALLGGGIELGACTTNPTTGQVGLNPAVIDFITSAVATVAQYLPSAESIAATAAALFGPGYAAIVQIGSSAINTVIAALESAVSGLSQPAQARLMAKLKASASTLLVNIGTIHVTGPNGPSTVTVTGTRV